MKRRAIFVHHCATEAKSFQTFESTSRIKIQRLSQQQYFNIKKFCRGRARPKNKFARSCSRRGERRRRDGSLSRSGGRADDDTKGEDLNQKLRFWQEKLEKRPEDPLRSIDRGGEMERGPFRSRREEWNIGSRETGTE